MLDLPCHCCNAHARRMVTGVHSPSAKARLTSTLWQVFINQGHLIPVIGPQKTDICRLHAGFKAILSVKLSLCMVITSRCPALTSLRSSSWRGQAL